MIRDDSVPVGQSGPLHLICGCGERVSVVGEVQTCRCGLAYDARGWVMIRAERAPAAWCPACAIRHAFRSGWDAGYQAHATGGLGVAGRGDLLHGYEMTAWRNGYLDGYADDRSRCDMGSGLPCSCCSMMKV